MFTELEKVDIRCFLGWPAIYLQVYSALEYSIQAVESKPETEAKVREILAVLNAFDVRLSNAYCSIKADQVGDIKIGRMSEINILRSEARRYVGRLGALLNVGIREDAFGGYARSSNSNAMTIV